MQLRRGVVCGIMKNRKHRKALLGLGDIYVKDESFRFGLNAFKVLGGSYAMGRFLAERLGLDEGARVLFFSTEGDTDRENYRSIVWDGTYPSHP